MELLFSIVSLSSDFGDPWVLLFSEDSNVSLTTNAAEAIIFSFLGSRHFKVVSSKILSHLIAKVLLHLHCFVNGTKVKIPSEIKPHFTAS